jgi:hypothetical protein
VSSRKYNHNAVIVVHNIITITMTGTSAPPRRSGRERKQVESVYTDAKKVVAAEMKAKKSSAAPRSKSSERGSR